MSACAANAPLSSGASRWRSSSLSPIWTAIAVADRPVEVQAARLEWKYRHGAWREEEVDVQECTVGSTAEPVSCTFETEAGGEYQITATVTDAQGRQNQSQFTRWVSGGQRPPARKVELETVTLIPDKESYQPGDVAQILVQAPFSPAEGLLTVSRSGLLYTERFQHRRGHHHPAGAHRGGAHPQPARAGRPGGRRAAHRRPGRGR